MRFGGGILQLCLGGFCQISMWGIRFGNRDICHFLSCFRVVGKFIKVQNKCRPLIDKCIVALPNCVEFNHDYLISAALYDRESERAEIANLLF